MKTKKDEQEELRRYKAQHLQRISNHVDPEKFTPGYIQLGKHLEYGISYPEAGVIIDQYKLVALERKRAFEHILIMGKPGAGKSYYALNWLVHQFLHEIPDAKMCVLECKGSATFIQTMASRVAQTKKTPVPLFYMGMQEKGTLYDGFRGTGDAIYNRLTAMLGIQKADEAADTAFHAGHQRIALDLACNPPPPFQPPKDWVELYNRMSPAGLRKLYNKDKYPSENAMIENLKSESVSGATTKIAAWVRRFQLVMGQGGFDFEDYSGIFFSYKSGSASDDVTRAVHGNIENLMDFMGNPKRQKYIPGVGWEPVIFILDEFFDMGNIVTVLRQGREFNICVILSIQDTSLLGRNENDKQRLLSSVGTFIVMRSDYPDLLVELAGTKLENRLNIQFDERGATNKGSVSKVENSIVNPNEIRGLADGQAFVIRQNLVWKIQFPTSPQITHNPDDIVKRERIVPPERPDDKGNTNRPYTNIAVMKCHKELNFFPLSHILPSQ